jgi:putative hydroxymethylpyrimidine transporter CytX
VIAESGNKVIGGGWRWPLVLVAGVIATSMAIRPLAFVRVLKRYLVWVVLASTVYLFVEVLRHHLPGLTDGTWNGFWPAVDLVAALAVSWMPLAADYTRQARSPKEAFWGAAVGYGVTSAAFFVLGVLVFVSVGGDDVLGSLLAIPAGTIALLVLAVDEIDEAFANIYSTAVSAQNVLPRVDRRILAIVVGALASVLALIVDIQQYQSFLYLLGSVFVPLFAVFIVDYYVLRRRDWDVSESAPARWSMLLPWLVGFVTYQLVNPGQVGWWQRWWVARQHDLHFHPPTWLSASLASFVVASALTFLVSATTRRGRRSDASPALTA